MHQAVAFAIASKLCRKRTFARSFSESVPTAVWCILGFGAILKFPSNPQNRKNKQKILEKGTFIFCAKPWYAPNPGSKEIGSFHNENKTFAISFAKPVAVASESLTVDKGDREINSPKIFDWLSL